MSKPVLSFSPLSVKPRCSPPPHRNVATHVLRLDLISRTWPSDHSHGRRLHSTRSESRSSGEPGKHEPLHKDERKSWLATRERQRMANREFFTNLLTSAATKRDAKAYISRLKTPSRATPPPSQPTPPAPRAKVQTQVNLGDLYARSRAVKSSPVFSQYEDIFADETEEQETLHVALVKLSNVSSMTDEIVDGIAKTLSSLSRLSMAPCVVLEEPLQTNRMEYKDKLNDAADRIVAAIDKVGDSGARRVDNALSFGDDGRPKVFLRKLITRPLRRGKILVVLPVAYSERRQNAIQIAPDEALLALTRELSSTATKRPTIGQTDLSTKEAQPSWKPISLDRIIVVDETGCIPSTKALDKKHVFVNLQQEYSALQEELRSSTDGNVSVRHATNLTMFRDALSMLPHTSSGLLTTPAEAANTSKETDTQSSGVGTRRQKNPLIHNLLTDKPAYSSSLPSGRLAPDSEISSATTSTFVKRGMPLILLPNPLAQVWTAAGSPRLELTDPRIDLDRLVYLIDDSFNRKLDVEAYLKRVNDRIAGVIIAGDYEGGAILTWETPPGVPDTDTSRLVPYLDKFAVLKKSQGAGGVADIVFNAMVRTCFPNGVCWRSRKDNPVNKWYFERSRGTWKIQNTNWTMFWTTPGLPSADNKQVFSDYEAVCRTVKPTWADNQKLVD